jgi:hypothetical protein
VVAVCFFGVGDVATTTVGLGLPGVTEASPYVRGFVYRHGLAGMVSLKVAALSIAFVVWRSVPRPYAVGVPLGLATIGVVLTAWNLFVVFLAMP